MARKLRNILLAILLIHLVWWACAKLVNKDIIPDPLKVYAIMPQMFKQGVGMDIYASLYRIFWGLLIAIIFGVLIGIAIVRFPKFGSIANPILYFVYPIPKIALLPVLMLCLGIGESSKIGMLILANVFQIIVSVRDQVKQVSPTLYQTLKVLDATRLETFRYITWPASITGTISAIRIALSTSFAILFITEAYGTQLGLGYYIMDEWSKMEYLQMYGGIVIISFLAFIMFILLEMIDNYTSRWRKKN